MNTPTLTLAAVLLLGSATFVHAQRDGAGPSGPTPEMRGGEAGPGMPGPDGPGGRSSNSAPGPGAGDADSGAPRRAGGESPPGREDAAGDRAGREAGPSPQRVEPTRDRDRARPGAEEKAERKGDTRRRDDARASKPAVEKDKAPAKDAARGDKKDAAAGKPDPAQPERKGADTKAGENGRDAPKAAEADRKAPEQAKKADLSGERGERVRSAFHERRDVKRRTGVHVDLAVGARLPSDWDYVPVPVAVVEVVPEYAGYVYTYVEDEYVILDPVTYEVVAVLPASGGSGATYARSGGGGGGGAGAADDACADDLALAADERALIVRSVQLSDEVDVPDVAVGATVPRDIELKAFPEPVLSRSGKLASCRYFVADDRIAVVDPEEDTVVLLIAPE